MRFCNQHLKRFAIILALAVLFAISWMVYCGISMSLTAERSLHANLLVVDLVREYIVANKGAWPQSWHDLESMPVRQRAMFAWPVDRAEIERYVTVDFATDPDKLATKSVEEFAAVEPKGYRYPCKHYPEIAQLLETIRQTRYQTKQ